MGTTLTDKEYKFTNNTAGKCCYKTHLKVLCGKKFTFFLTCQTGNLSFVVPFQLQSKHTVLHQLVGERVTSSCMMMRSLQAMLDQVVTVSSCFVFTL